MLRSTHLGILSGFAAVLLGFCSPHALANDDTSKGNNTPGNGGLQTTRPISFAIDRSPMQTSIETIQQTHDMITGNLLGGLVQFDLNNSNRKICFQIPIPPITSSETLRTKLDEILNLSKPPEVRIDSSMKDRFNIFFLTNVVNEKKYPVGSTPLRRVLSDAINNLVNGKERQLENEIRRLDALLIYELNEFALQKADFRREAFAVEEQGYVAGRQNVSATNFLYSNTRLRTDVAAQYLTGTRNGFGFALNYDLVGYGYSLNQRYPKPEEKILADLEKPADNKDFINSTTALINDLSDPAKQYNESFRLTRYLLAPHYGLSADFRRLNGLGDFYSVGLSASILRPQRSWREDPKIPIQKSIEKHKSDAMFYSIGLRYHWFEADRWFEADQHIKRTQGVGFSAVVAWQDASPFFYTEEYTTNAQDQVVEKAELRPWHTQYGVEFAQHNAIVQKDYFAVFGRWREGHNTNSQTFRKQGFEYGLQVGVEVNGDMIVGGNISFYFK